MYSIGEFSKRTNISKRTLVRWDQEKKLVAYRSPSGRRYYSEEQCSVYQRVLLTESENESQYYASRTSEAHEVYLKAFSSSREVVTQSQIDSLKIYCQQQLGIQVELINFQTH
jgi:excisionase family DNA binding protein